MLTKSLVICYTTKYCGDNYSMCLRKGKSYPAMREGKALTIYYQTSGPYQKWSVYT
jgi:hypothetical protein